MCEEGCIIVFIIIICFVCFVCSGKQIAGESIIETAVRELREECGISMSTSDLMPRGIIMFEFRKGHEESWFFEVHLFSGDYNGDEICESDEMKPEWFKIKEVPLSNMWEDDKYWLPYILCGGYALGYYVFDDCTQEMISGVTEGILKASDGNGRCFPPRIPARFPKDFRKWIAEGGFCKALE